MVENETAGFLVRVVYRTFGLQHNPLNHEPPLRYERHHEKD